MHTNDGFYDKYKDRKLFTYRLYQSIPFKIKFSHKCIRVVEKLNELVFSPYALHVRFSFLFKITN